MVKKLLRMKGQLLIAFLLGCLLTFAFAPYNLYLLAIFSPAGLLALWLNASPKRAFWLGFAFGMGLFGLGIYWVYISIHDIGGVPIALSCFITIGLAAILALFPASVGYLFKRFFNVHTPITLVGVFPALWVAFEWIRSFVFTGFPWLFIGYSQTYSPLRGFAPIASVYGVSFATLLCSGLLVKAWLILRQKKFSVVFSSLLLIVIIFAIGQLLTYAVWTKPTHKPLRVALVQGNITQVIKWSPEYLQLSMDTYTRLTEPLWGKTDLIIWPETAIPLPLQNAESFIQTLDDKATRSHTALILGIPIQATDSDGFYNAIVTLGADKKVYLKRRLVPFGEYTPFLHFFSHLFNSMNIPISDVIPGGMQQGLLTIDGIKIQPAICYEIGFPQLMNVPAPDLSFILTITNDAWFGKSNAQAQHLQMASMRAIELARPLIFVSNDGITALINPDGKIAARAPAHKEAVLEGMIQPMQGLTPWMRYSMAPILLLLIYVICIGLWEKHLAKRNKTIHSK